MAVLAASRGGVDITTNETSLDDLLAGWRLPAGTDLLGRVEEMIRPALLAGHFGRSSTRLVSGLQYHLGGARDTAELATLADVGPEDHVLDVCCFVGGPALQLAHSVGCRVTGVDLDRSVITAARRIAAVTGLEDLLRFRVADAVDLPFEDGRFTVVWNQCSLPSDERWIREFDRVLARGGRLALTFQRQGHDDDRWTQEQLAAVLVGLGYEVSHRSDLTRRDIEIGWKALLEKLSEREAEYQATLGDRWIREARREFRAEIERMANGEYGNARIVASRMRRASGDGRC